VITATLPNRKYIIRCHHSGIETLRNRRFIKETSPNVNRYPSTPDLPNPHITNHSPDYEPEAEPFMPSNNQEANNNPPPPVPQTGQATNDNNLTSIPRALKRLQDFNKPGLKQ